MLRPCYIALKLLTYPPKLGERRTVPFFKETIIILLDRLSFRILVSLRRNATAEKRLKHVHSIAYRDPQRDDGAFFPIGKGGRLATYLKWGG